MASTRFGRPGRRLVQTAGIALGIVAFGATGLTGALAQTEDDAAAVAGTTVLDEGYIESILAEVFGEVFGAVPAEDDSTVSGGNINVGGNLGGEITMGGSTGGGISIGGGSGGSGGGAESGG